jgi:hypothetical protein
VLNGSHFIFLLQVLLQRIDYQEEERNVFKPAEWRWSIPQVKP